MGWGRFFQRRKWDEIRGRELQSYLDLETAENISLGMSPEEARAAAHKKLGNMTHIREEIYRMNSIGFIEVFVMDFRFALRILRKSPGFTAVAGLTLALAIGANTALFSAVNAVLFKPLPVTNPKELVDIFTVAPHEIVQYQPMAYPDYLDLREESKTLAGAMGFAPVQVALDQHGDGELIFAEEVTGNYFDLLGVRPLLGRGFDPEHDRATQGDPAAVLSYATWKQRFHGDAGIVGKTIILNEHIITVAGVAPPEFRGMLRGIAPAMWLPISMDSTLHLGNPVEDRGSQWLFVVGRLRHGATLSQAQAEANTIAARLAQAYPSSNKDRSAGLLPASDVKIFPEADKALSATSLVLLGFVALILLIACANVSGMLLARASVRRREFAVRTALGAGRMRLIRQLLTECLLISFFGGILALVSTAFLNRMLSDALEGIHLTLPVGFGLDLGLDFRVLGFTFAVVVGTTSLFGLFPALRASRGKLALALKEEAGAATVAHQKHRFLNGLVVGQVTVSLMLLICAGLSLRSLWNASRVAPGFDPANVATAAFNPSLAGYTPEQAGAYYRNLTERLRSLPGVQSVGLADTVPLAFMIRMTSCAPEGKDPSASSSRLIVSYATVGGDYFDAMRVPILRGRGFTKQDSSTSSAVVIVNQTLANQLWPGQDAVGRRVSLSGGNKYFEVVGVAADGKYITLGEESRPYLYRALQQEPRTDLLLLVRTAADPHAFLASIRQVSRALDARVPVTGLETLQEKTSVSLLLPRAGGVLFGLFGLLGLILATVGLYGVVAYSVSQRTREIGIRMALGAAPRDISQLVIGRGLALVLVGVALGLAGGFGLTRVLSIILYGVSATDPGTFAGVAIFLILVALAACLAPARRAMRIDPMVALHYE